MISGEQAPEGLEKAEFQNGIHCYSKHVIQFGTASVLQVIIPRLHYVMHTSSSHPF